MSKFILFTEDTGIGKQMVLVNVSQIAIARFDKENGQLIVIMAGSEREFPITGDEAKAALAVLRNKE